MSNIKYREAKSSDWDSIKFIISLYPKILMQDHLPNWSKFFVAEADGRVVGCVAIDIYSKRIGEIRSLAVLPDYQEQGIGTHLVELCLSKAKAKSVSEIITITGTEKLFQKFGFSTFNNERIALFKIL
ncbi:hypothetical protein A3A03_03795 [Candidatus Nomurabacteria bacterium RIFCSPLOWO2_01_FULL_40_18]|uniref:N-acetyltransferase domain-containing protein n=1 Tax=Candidatus Nomurabacteria bacterium RIFCSPLOWO2_01_FULL_40_18 TaxID=1801773 RepID=A0A1F6XJP0_9BACT|nr:MAG: hypothetical protein A3A03_03795 [Candidatus Nomurabacteria bacterium RIFCSPLOWO2_01_FULL_40_18]